MMSRSSRRLLSETADDPPVLVAPSSLVLSKNGSGDPSERPARSQPRSQQEPIGSSLLSESTSPPLPSSRDVPVPAGEALAPADRPDIPRRKHIAPWLLPAVQGCGQWPIAPRCQRCYKVSRDASVSRKSLEVASFSSKGFGGCEGGRRLVWHACARQPAPPSRSTPQQALRRTDRNAHHCHPSPSSAIRTSATLAEEAKHFARLSRGLLKAAPRSWAGSRQGCRICQARGEGRVSLSPCLPSPS